MMILPSYTPQKYVPDKCIYKITLVFLFNLQHVAFEVFFKNINFFNLPWNSFCIANFKLAATTFYIHTIKTKQKRRFYTFLREELQTKVWQKKH